MITEILKREACRDNKGPKESGSKPTNRFKKLMEVEKCEEVQVCAPTPLEAFTPTPVKPCSEVDAVGVVDAIYERLCEKMVIMENNGIERIEVHFSPAAENSPLRDLTFSIERYDTAPSEWNICFEGHPEAVNLLTPEVSGLEMRLKEHFVGHAIRIAPPELLKKERFAKRETLVSSEKNREQKWKRVQAAGSATSQH